MRYDGRSYLERAEDGGAGSFAQPTYSSAGMLYSLYGYQDYQYFLTSGDGPWGTLEWTYDTIGNRLSESRDGAAADTYVYETNTAGTGNRSRLDRIHLGMTGTRDYTFGDAGHLEQVAAGANVVNFTNDQEGRLAGLERLGNAASMHYDGRSYLERVEDGGNGNFTEPTYSSEGMLLSLYGSQDNGATTNRRHLVYFAGRPVGLLQMAPEDGETYTFLHTDHVGTPFIASDNAGVEIWAGGFEPFGQDWQQGTQESAQKNGIFLRFPGQWIDGSWAEASSGSEVAYNLYRWYSDSLGSYLSTDPDHMVSPGSQPTYSYALNNPISLTDPTGERVATESFLKKHLDCALDKGPKEFRDAYNKMVADRDKRIRSARYDQVERRSFNWPTNCKTKTKFILVEELQTPTWKKTPIETCPELIEGIIHETIEAAANCYSGLKPKSSIDPSSFGTPKPDIYAHDYASTIQFDKYKICACCSITD
jgi:RHS repeat-associated protein